MQTSNSIANVSDLYHWTDRYVPAELIAKKYKVKILELLSKLPPSLTSAIFSYECPLEESRKWGDIAFVVEPKTLSSADFSIDARWAPLTNLLKNGYHLFRPDCISRLWVGFDVGSNLNDQPNVLFSSFGNETDLISVLQDTYFWTTGERISQKRLHLLEKGSQKNFQYRAFGFMLARPGIFRFRIGSSLPLSSREVASYLDSVNHPGLDTSFYQIYEKFSPLKTQLYLGMKEEILPRVDLLIESKTPANWKTIFQELISQKIISEKSRAALLAWEGCQLEVDKGSRHFLHRQIGRIKISFYPDQRPTVKAYFGVFAYQYLGNLSKYANL